MPKATKEPDPNRRQTRPANANAHPGRVALEALAVRRKPEEIERDKQIQNERRKAREKKTSNEQAAIKDIVEFENEMAVEDLEQKAKFPRRQTEGESGPRLVNMCYSCAVTFSGTSKNKKRKGPSKAISHSKRELDGSLDTEPESDADQRKPKKLKSGAMPLRRTG